VSRLTFGYAALRLYGDRKTRATPLFGGPDEVSVLLIRVVSCSTTTPSQRRDPKKTHDVSEGLRPVGVGVRSAGARMIGIHHTYLRVVAARVGCLGTYGARATLGEKPVALGDASTYTTLPTNQ
jgi:hypothetical protein